MKPRLDVPGVELDTSDVAYITELQLEIDQDMLSLGGITSYKSPRLIDEIELHTDASPLDERLSRKLRSLLINGVHTYGARAEQALIDSVQIIMVGEEHTSFGRNQLPFLADYMDKAHADRDKAAQFLGNLDELLAESGVVIS